MEETEQEKIIESPIIFEVTETKDGKEIKHTIIFKMLSCIFYDVYYDEKSIGTLIFNGKPDEVEITVNDEFLANNDELKNEIIQIFKDKYLCLDSSRLIGEPTDIKYDKDKKSTYLSLLFQAIILRNLKAGKSLDYSYKQYENVASWLDKGDFFTAPASTRFHDSEVGGLLNHSLKVYNYICDLHTMKTFEGTDIAEASLCALVHDWCKIGLYESYMRNVKDDKTGQWNQVESFRHTNPKFPFGHGESSMYIAGKFFHLSMEESLAIRWHMGKYYTDDSLDDDLSEASNKYPLVNMLQFADKLSITEY